MRKTLAALMVVLSLVIAQATPAAAASRTKVIVLPGAVSAEAIAAGEGNTFYAGDLFRGTIFKGDIRRGTAEPFINVPNGTMTVGMDFDARHDLLFVAGGPGKAFVYNTRTRALVASYDFGDATTSFINDVVLTPYGAWFTDSLQPKLYFVPETFGIPGPARTLNLTGPAAGKPGTFTINDIASTPSGNTLFVAPEGTRTLCTINPFTGTSSVVDNVDIPDTDGLMFDHGQLWATQRFINQISQFRLSDDLRSGTLEKVITDPLLRVPLTTVKFGDRLAVVNSHLDTGYPPTSPTYEVLVIHA
jgi:sugar lactone lactonase YvrE